MNLLSAVAAEILRVQNPMEVVEHPIVDVVVDPPESDTEESMDSDVFNDDGREDISNNISGIIVDEEQFASMEQGREIAQHLRNLSIGRTAISKSWTCTRVLKNLYKHDSTLFAGYITPDIANTMTFNKLDVRAKLIFFL